MSELSGEGPGKGNVPVAAFGGEPLWTPPLPAALMGKPGKPRLLLNKLNCSFSSFTSKVHNYEKLSEHNDCNYAGPTKQAPIPVLFHMDNFLYFRPVGIYNVLTFLAQISSIKSVNLVENVMFETYKNFTKKEPKQVVNIPMGGRGRRIRI